MNVPMFWQLILLPLILTQLIELPISIFLVKDRPIWMTILAVVALNCITNPCLNIFLFFLTGRGVSRLIILVVGELLVLSCETIGLKLLLDLTWLDALKVSLAVRLCQFDRWHHIEYIEHIVALILNAH